MMISVVMPSYLGEYPGAAKGRPEKFVRAVDSVLNQSFTNFELIIVADGCQETERLFATIAPDPRLRLVVIERSELWCPGPRNTGIAEAGGQWIAYLDTDDVWGPEHLATIHEQVITTDAQWAYMPAWWHSKKGWYVKVPNLKNCASYGTANVVHRNIKGLYWPTQRRNRDGVLDYGTQDCAFVERLKRLGVPLAIPTSEYYVCHIPSHVAGAYDV